MTNLIENARQLREHLLRDRHRPTYHITTPEGVCAPFDPNGALFWRGRYHLMYIVQTPKGHCWAHISSADLAHWRHHPLALEPGNGDAGIFSGGASLDRNGVPTIAYWGLGDPGGICIATSTDDQLETWTKNSQNPVIRETSPGYAVLKTDQGEVVYGAADPSAMWIHNGRYYMITGNLLVLREYGLKRNMAEHQGDTAYLFVSDDSTTWRYVHPFYTSDRRWTRADEDDMCPDFFALPAAAGGGASSDRYMLLFISHNLGCQYYIGRYADDRFHPETHGRMTWADNAFFAPESLADGTGRRIMWAWIFDGRERSVQEASMWSGMLSLPRVLWLAEDKTLRMTSAEELAILRADHKTSGGRTVKADTEAPLKDISGDSLELCVEMAARKAASYGIKVLCSPDGQEQTIVFYDAIERKLKIDTTRSSLGGGLKSVEGGPLELAPDEPLRLKIFVDRSVVEVFANDRQAVARCVYPTRDDSLGVVLFSRGGPAEVAGMDAWKMSPANPW